MFCPKCGTENPSDGLFCGSCGAKIERRDAPAQKQTAASAPAPAPAKTPTTASAKASAAAPSVKSTPASAKAPGGLSSRNLGIIALASVVAVLLLVFAASSAMCSSRSAESAGSYSSSTAGYDEAGSDDAPKNMDEVNEYLETGSVDSDDDDDAPKNIDEVNEYLSGESASSSTGGSSAYVGTWIDSEYGDSLTVRSDGTATIVQQGEGTTNWTWTDTGSGIRITNAANTYDLTYGLANGSTYVLYNNAKGLLFEQR